MAGTWLETAAHLADHVIRPVPVRQWVISVRKRLRCFLADRPAAVRDLTKIFLAEIERLLSAAAGVTIDADALPATRPRLGAVSLLHRFGSTLNHHAHLHVCATDGVFVPAAAEAGCDANQKPRFWRIQRRCRSMSILPWKTPSTSIPFSSTMR